MFKYLLAASLTALCVWSLTDSELQAKDFAVVVSAKSPVKKLSKRQVKRLYLGRSKKLPGAGKAVVIDYSQGNPWRASFYKDVIGKYGSKLESYWSKLKFTGRGQPPSQFSSVEEVIKTLESNPNAISYLPKSEVTANLKVLYQHDS